MFRLCFFILSLLIFGGAAQNTTKCGAFEIPDEIFGEQVDFSLAAERQGHIHVNTYVHIVTTKKARHKYSLKQVHRQIRYMNRAYGPHKISFGLVDTTFTINEAWANHNPDSYHGRPTDIKMKKALRRGSYNDLNLYFTSGLNTHTNFIGTCHFPHAKIRSKPKTFILDGCVMAAGGLPGGHIRYNNLGGLATHEVGHWFGVLHPFQGGCHGGDHVADTPPQRTPSYGCPRHKDTCKSPGKDNIHNFMDYSDDYCLTHFTKGQAARMHHMFRKFRAGH